MNFEKRQFYRVQELKTKEKQEILNLTDYYSEIVLENKLTERGLLKLLRETLSVILPQFVSVDFLELIHNFRTGQILLVLLQGDLFDKSMPLSHTQEFVGTKVLMPQEVLAMIMSFLVRHSFGIDGERLDMVQRGAKIANYAEKSSVSGTGVRGFHIDNPQNSNHLADFLFFMLNNSGEIYTNFSAVLVEELEKYKVGNYSLLEILIRPNFETLATLNCLQNTPPRIHSVISEHKNQFAEIILNENTVTKQEKPLINTELPNRWEKLALEVLRKLLQENSINLPYNMAFVSQTLGQSVLHAVQEIPDYRLKEICADPNNPEYLYFRELLRVYIAENLKTRKWVPEIEGLESLYGTFTNVVA